MSGNIYTQQNTAEQEARLQNQNFIERQALAARATATMNLANRHNRPKATTLNYLPKQREFSAWCTDPTQGKYSNDLVNAEKLRRFIVEQLLVMDDSTIISGRSQRQRGRKQLKVPILGKQFKCPVTDCNVTWDFPDNVDNVPVSPAGVQTS